MQSVHFAEIVSRALAERDGIQPSESAFDRKLIENPCRRAYKMRMMCEQVAALADIDRAQLSGPIVYVAK